MEHSRPEFIILEEFSKLLREVAELRREVVELRLDNKRLKEESYVRNSGLKDFKVEKPDVGFTPVPEGKSRVSYPMVLLAPEMFTVLSSVLERLVFLSESRIREHGSAWHGYAWYSESFDLCISDIRAIISKVRGE